MAKVLLSICFPLFVGAFRDRSAHMDMLNSDAHLDGQSSHDAISINETIPFQAWYPDHPLQLQQWADKMLAKYRGAWVQAGCPRGVLKDDHDYNTVLGQGNTLGFVTGHLTLGKGPPRTRHGLFAASGSVPAVVRFSDFGATDSTVRLARAAIKVPLKDAWGGEVNLLFTETLDSFPMNDYGELASFADGQTTFGQAVHFAGYGAKNLIALALAQRRELLAKSYYSQVPYQLGARQAMKFSLVPKQETCSRWSSSSPCCLPPAAPPTGDSAPSWATTRAAATASFLAKCPAEFELQLQVKDFDSWNNGTILHSAGSSWLEAPVTVGILTIPPQSVTSDTATSETLQAAIAAELGVEPEGVHKMFAFHPIITHKDNRPVGDINTFRASFYRQHAALRLDTIHNGTFRTTAKDPLRTVPTMPFEALVKSGVL